MAIEGGCLLLLNRQTVKIKKFKLKSSLTGARACVSIQILALNTRKAGSETHGHSTSSWLWAGVTFKLGQFFPGQASHWFIYSQPLCYDFGLAPG
jgi:hypothetical protein